MRSTGRAGEQLAAGDVLLLGDDTIHAVTNPLGRLTGAIHVYAGDFVNEPRSQWGPGPVEERPYDIERRPPAVRRGQRRLAGPGRDLTARGVTGWAAAGEDGGHRDVDRAPGALPTSPGHPLLTRRASARHAR